MKAEDILSRVDHTLLAPTATWEEVKTLCEEAIAYKTASVMIPSSYVAAVAEEFGDALCIGTVVGFPNGNSSTAAKLAETAEALADGASEIDMVLHIGALKAGDTAYVTEEIYALKKLCGTRVLKVIVETCLLTEEEKIRACHAVTEGGADYIKTSTGFSSAGATMEDIALFRRYIGDGVKIKAAGGIRTRAAMEEFIAAGCDRIGASAAVRILRDEIA